MDEQELTRLVEKFSGTVYRAAYCCLHNSADADDITQDTFLVLYTSCVEFTGDEHIKAWLLRVALNRCRNVLSPHLRQLNIETGPKKRLKIRACFRDQRREPPCDAA